MATDTQREETPAPKKKRGKIFGDPIYDGDL